MSWINPADPRLHRVEHAIRRAMVQLDRATDEIADLIGEPPAHVALEAASTGKANLIIGGLFRIAIDADAQVIAEQLVALMPAETGA